MSRTAAAAIRTPPSTNIRVASTPVWFEAMHANAAMGIETYMRNHLVADATAAGDRSEPASATDDVFERAGRHLLNHVAKQQIAYLRSTILGRIGADVLVPHKAGVLAIVGSGDIAEAQLRAAIAHRDFQQVRIFSRQPVAAAALAKKFRQLVSKPIEVASSPEAALHKANVVVLASEAHRPVVDPDWIMPGAHITCAFRQTNNAHELPPQMIARARVVVADCPGHISMDSDHPMSTSYDKRKILHLGSMIDHFDPDHARGTSILFLTGADELALPLLKAVAQVGEALA